MINHSAPVIARSFISVVAHSFFPKRKQIAKREVCFEQHPCGQVTSHVNLLVCENPSLPELLNCSQFCEKTLLVVNSKFRLFCGRSTEERIRVLKFFRNPEGGEAQQLVPRSPAGGAKGGAPHRGAPWVPWAKTCRLPRPKKRACRFSFCPRQRERQQNGRLTLRRAAFRTIAHTLEWGGGGRRLAEGKLNGIPFWGTPIFRAPTIWWEQKATLGLLASGAAPHHPAGHQEMSIAAPHHAKVKLRRFPDWPRCF